MLSSDLINFMKIKIIYRYYQQVLAKFYSQQILSSPERAPENIIQLMRNYRKGQSPRFKKRSPFQSPQCSTVVQVNPSCQSEESMLQKIIFTDNLASNNDYQNERHLKEPLQQRSINTKNANHEIRKLNRNYKYFNQKADEKQSKDQFLEYRSKQNQENFINRFESYRSSKQKYEPQKQTDKYSRQRTNSLSSAQSLSNLMQRTASRQLGSRLYSYQSSEFRKNYSTQKYNNQPSYNNQYDSQTVIDEVKLRQIQQKIMRYRQQNQKTTPLGSKEIQKQPPKIISFRDTMESHLNNIQISFLPSQQNKLKKKQTIIDNISLIDKDYNPYPISSQKNAQNLTRVPGKLLSQNKGLNRKESEFIENKRFQIYQKGQLYPSHSLTTTPLNKFTANPPNTFKENTSNNFRIYSEVRNTIEIPAIQDAPNQKKTERQKITKKVYMQPTQKTEIDELYQPRCRQRYETEIDLNEKALGLMLEEERAKKYEPFNIEKEKKMQFNGDDDELQRLNNLQKKFNQHFNSRK